MRAAFLVLAILFFGCIGQPPAAPLNFTPHLNMTQPAPAANATSPGNATPQQNVTVPQEPPPAQTDEVLRDLTYATVNGTQLQLDLYFPQKQGPLPTLIYIHGGGWRIGDKSGCQAQGLVWHGYAVASINYRLSNESKFPAQIHDVKAAIRWLRANAGKYDLDPDRFGVWGDSAGGHLAALAGTSGDVPELEGSLGVTNESSRVQAVVDWFGPADFRTVENASDPGGKYFEYYEAAAQLMGGPIISNHDKAADASPITYITPDDPPFLIIHGDIDETVPLKDSQLLHAALLKAGVNSTLVVRHGEGHGFQGDEAFNTTKEFLDAALK